MILERYGESGGRNIMRKIKYFNEGNKYKWIEEQERAVGRSMLNDG